MTPLVLVAALLLFSPLAAEAQNTTKKKLKVAVPPFTFESIIIHSGAEGEINPTGGWLFLEATNGLSKLPGYEIEWMPAYEIMTDLDAVAWGSRALKEKRWDLVVGGPPRGIERPEMKDIISIPSAMVHVAVLGLKRKRDPNMMQFVTPFAADVWLTLGACVLLGAAVIVALMFAEERSMHNAQAAQGKARREGLGRVTVRGVSIDADLRQITTIDPAHVAVIKLDIQGHEYEALAGAIKTIREHHPVLYFEYSPHLFKGAHEADVNKVLCLAMLVGGYKCTIPLRGELAFCVPNSLGRNTRVLHPDTDVQRPYSSGARNIPRYH